MAILNVFVRYFDPHVLYTLLQRGWTILAGGVTLLLLPYTLTAVEQGYYYAFASLIAMQVFFDLGFNSVVVQLVSHEIPKIRVGAGQSTLKPDPHRSRLASLVLLLRRWYKIAAVLFFLIICPLGYLFFQSQGSLSTVSWMGPWTLQLLFTSINLYFSPLLAVSEGQGHVGEVAKLRLSQSIAGHFLMWILMTGGAGLWVSSVVPLVSVLITFKWLRGRHDNLLIGQEEGQPTVRISWYREIFPFQWRIAISWVSGYFIFSLFTPMIFRHQGPVEAGQVGMTLMIFSSLSTLGMSWVSAKVPNFSMLIAQGQRAELNELFMSVLKKSLLLTTAGCAIFLSAVMLLEAIGVALLHRIAEFPVLLCLTAVTIANTVIFAAAAYMRAHKEEPMLLNSVTTGIVVLGAVWFFSKVSVVATMLSYTALVLLISLPWTLLIFFRRYYYRKA